MRAGLTAGLLYACAALGHAKGTHQRTVVTLSGGALRVLTTCDVDGGKRAGLFRAAADLDRNGRIEGVELDRLRARLSTLLGAHLRLTMSSYPVLLKAEATKLDLRGEYGVGEVGFSSAVLLSAELPEPPRPGMVLEVNDRSLDGAPVAVEVHEDGADGGERATRGEVKPGRPLRHVIAGPSGG